MAPKNYYKSVAENKDVSKYVMMMSSAVSTLKADIIEALQGYSDYAFLWEQDRDEAVRVRWAVFFYLIFFFFFFMAFYSEINIHTFTLIQRKMFCHNLCTKVLLFHWFGKQIEC